MNRFIHNNFDRGDSVDLDIRKPNIFLGRSTKYIIFGSFS